MSLMVTKKTLGELVATRIREYVLEQGLKAGDRLPTEQQFAEMFGVSRVVVREATKSLGYLGIIRAAPRRGLTVGAMDNDRLGELIAFNYLLSRMEPAPMIKAWSILTAGTMAASREPPAGVDWADLAALAARADADGVLSEAEIQFTMKVLLAWGSPGVSFYVGVVMRYLRTCLVKGRKRPEPAKPATVYRQAVELLKNKRMEEVQALLLAHINGIVIARGE